VRICYSSGGHGTRVSSWVWTRLHIQMVRRQRVDSEKTWTVSSYVLNDVYPSHSDYALLSIVAKSVRKWLPIVNLYVLSVLPAALVSAILSFFLPSFLSLYVDSLDDPLVNQQQFTFFVCQNQILGLTRSNNQVSLSTKERSLNETSEVKIVQCSPQSHCTRTWNDFFLSFLSFFLGFRKPNLITGLSGLRTPD